MDDQDVDIEFAAHVKHGIARVGPIVFLLTIGAVWALTGQAFGDAVRTGVLPGVLLGVFVGGFIGTLRSAWNQH